MLVYLLTLNTAPICHIGILNWFFVAPAQKSTLWIINFSRVMVYIFMLFKNTPWYLISFLILQSVTNHGECLHALLIFRELGFTHDIAWWRTFTFMGHLAWLIFTWGRIFKANTGVFKFLFLQSSKQSVSDIYKTKDWVRAISHRLP